jgi:CTP synthase (UTP-ammonia lyase)
LLIFIAKYAIPATATPERIVKINVALVPKLKAAPGLKTKRSCKNVPRIGVGLTWLIESSAHTFVEKSKAQINAAMK